MSANFRLFILCITCIFLFAPITNNASITHSFDDEKIIITNKRQELVFSKKKKGVIAKLRVRIEAASTTNLPQNISHAVFFDSYSSVNKTQFTYDNLKRHRDPIISDYDYNGVFHSDLKIAILETPTFKKGEKTTIYYEKTFNDLKFLDPLYFSDQYNVENSEIIITIPSWLEVDIKTLNFENKDVKTLNTQTKSSKVYSYKAKNLKHNSNFSNIPSRSKIKPHLLVIPSFLQTKKEKIRLVENLDDIYKWYSSLVKTIGNDDSELNALVQEITAGKTTDTEKIKAIFYWVQDHIRYLAFEDGIMGFQPENCQTVLKNKYGDCKGMANLTKEMLTLAGYDARLTWLGTSDIPYTYDIPSLCVDNHMICTVILNGEKIFLDPTEKFADLRNYAYRIQGQQVLIEDGDNYFLDEVPTLSPDKSKQTVTYNLSLIEGQLSGTGIYALNGNPKTYFFNLLANTPKKEWNESVNNYISNYNKNVKTQLAEIPDPFDREKDISMNFDITIHNHVIDLEKELYVTIDSDFYFNNFTMPDKRSVPYEFSEQYFIKTTTNFKIPDGYSISSIPDPISIDHNKFSFNCNYKQEAGKIIYTKNIEIKDPLLLENEFEAWNQTIRQLTEFYANPIILNK